MMNKICYDTQFHSVINAYINRYRLNADITLPYDRQFSEPIYTKYKQNKHIIENLIEQYKTIITGFSELEVLQIILCYSNEKFLEEIKNLSKISLQNQSDILKAQRFNDVLLKYELLNYCSMPLGQKRRNIYRYFKEFFNMSLSGVNRLIYDLLRRGDILLYKNFVELNVKQPEEKFRYLLEKYYIPDRWLKDIFGLCDESISYFNKNFNRGFVSLQKMIRDYSLSVHLKRLFTNYVADKVCDIDGERIICTKLDIIKVLLEGYGDAKTDMVGLYVDYESVTESAPNSNELGFETLNDFEKFVEKLPFVLWTSEHYFRYCDLSVEDIDYIIYEIDFAKYNNSEISIELLYKDNQKLLAEYDVNNGAEFYSLLLHYKSKIKNYSISLKNYFIISIGNVNIHEQILTVLRVFKKVELSKFVVLYALMYGMNIQELSLYKAELDEYLLDDILYYNKKEILDEEKKKNRIKTKNTIAQLTNEEIEELKIKIRAPIYSLEYVQMMFHSVVGGKLGYKVTFANLRLLGYERIGGLIHRKEFRSIDDSVRAYLDEFDILRFEYEDKVLLYHEKVKPILDDFCNKFKLIEFAPESYISLRQLEANEITKDDIINYVDSVDRFSNGLWFTTVYQKHLGFKNELEFLGFDDYFYNSILKCSKRFAFAEIEKTILFRSGVESVTLFDLIEGLVVVSEKIDVYELLRIIKEDYGIDVTKNKLVATVRRKRKTEIYYNEIKEKVYKDKETYYGDIG